MRCRRTPARSGGPAGRTEVPCSRTTNPRTTQSVHQGRWHRRKNGDRRSARLIGRASGARPACYSPRSSRAATRFGVSNPSVTCRRSPADGATRRAAFQRRAAGGPTASRRAAGACGCHDLADLERPLEAGFGLVGPRRHEEQVTLGTVVWPTAQTSHAGRCRRVQASRSRLTRNGALPLNGWRIR